MPRARRTLARFPRRGLHPELAWQFGAGSATEGQSALDVRYDRQRRRRAQASDRLGVTVSAAAIPRGAKSGTNKRHHGGNAAIVFDIRAWIAVWQAKPPAPPTIYTVLP